MLYYLVESLKTGSGKHNDFVAPESLRGLHPLMPDKLCARLARGSISRGGPRSWHTSHMPQYIRGHIRENCHLDIVDKISYLACMCVCLSGHAVAQLVEALCYKTEGRGLESR
jgi:hypothetical protein